MINSHTLSSLKEVIPKDYMNALILCIAFICFPFLGCIMALALISHKQNVKLSFCICVVFAGLYGYSCLPHYTMDITRHYEWFYQTKNLKTINDFIEFQILSGKPDFGIDIIYRIAGIFTNNYQIVGFIGGAMYYGLLLASIINWINSFKNSNYTLCFWCTILFILALTPAYEFNGMRQGNAIMLFLFIISNKNFYKFNLFNQVILLILPSLLHFSILPISLVYLISVRLNNRQLKIATIILMGLGIFFIGIMNLLISILPSFGFIGVGIAMKINDYVFDTESGGLGFSGSRLRFFVIVFMLIIFPFIIWLLRKYKIPQSKYTKIFFNFTILLFGYIIFGISTSVGGRALMLFKLCEAFLFSYFGYNIFFKDTWKKKFKVFMWVIASLGIVFIIQANEYKFINMKLLYNPLWSIINIKTKQEGYIW